MRKTRSSIAPGLDGRLGSGMALGLIAGVVFMVFEVAMAGILGSSPFGPPRMIGAILLGQGALQPLGILAFVAITGLVVHFLLSTLYGGVFGAISWMVRPLRGNRGLLIGAATVYGLLLWIVNFYVISPVAFPWFSMANPVVQFFAHTFFYGAVLGLLLAWRLGKTEDRQEARGTAPVQNPGEGGSE